MKLRIIKYMTGYAIQRKVLWWWEYVREDDVYGSMMVEGNPPLLFNSKESAELGLLALENSRKNL